MTYTQQYDAPTGRLAGVVRDGVTFVPDDPANSDWRAFLAWNQAQPVPLSLAGVAPSARKPRPLYLIYQDLQALAAAQKTAVWSDLSAGTPRKYLLDQGPNAAAVGALDWAATDSGASGASLTAAKMRVAAAYCQDNPGYLVRPPFDATINVPGDQPA